MTDPKDPRVAFIETAAFTLTGDGGVMIGGEWAHDFKMPAADGGWYEGPAIGSKPMTDDMQTSDPPKSAFTEIAGVTPASSPDSVVYKLVEAEPASAFLQIGPNDWIRPDRLIAVSWRPGVSSRLG